MAAGAVRERPGHAAARQRTGLVRPSSTGAQSRSAGVPPQFADVRERPRPEGVQDRSQFWHPRYGRTASALSDLRKPVTALYSKDGIKSTDRRGGGVRTTGPPPTFRFPGAARPGPERTRTPAWPERAAREPGRRTARLRQRTAGFWNGHRNRMGRTRIGEAVPWYGRVEQEGPAGRSASAADPFASRTGARRPYLPLVAGPAPHERPRAPRGRLEVRRFSGRLGPGKIFPAKGVDARSRRPIIARPSGSRTLEVGAWLRSLTVRTRQFVRALASAVDFQKSSAECHTTRSRVYFRRVGIRPRSRGRRPSTEEFDPGSD